MQQGILQNMLLCYKIGGGGHCRAVYQSHVVGCGPQASYKLCQ